MKNIAAAVALVALCAVVFWVAPPGSLRDVDAVLPAPFTLAHGKFWAAPLDPASIVSARRRGGSVRVLENGREVAANFRNATTAIGTDTLAGNRVEFAVADGSDPNQNGRAYILRTGRARLPVALYLALIIVACLTLFALGGFLVERRLAGRPRLRRIAMALLSLLLLAALQQSIGATLVAERLANAEPVVVDLYGQMFLGSEGGGQPGSSAIYREHPNLNYVLNPTASYMNERQFNAHYRIRRKEPIRPKGEVAWRALVLGGSTTFGEGTAREEDVWVHRLERKMRDRYGNGYDVINGGIGGYNTLDNLLHYLLLLQDLDPDVVILYVGINDVHPRLFDDIEPDYTNSRIAWRPDYFTVPSANRWLSPLAIYRYAMLLQLQQRTFLHIYLLVQKQYPPAAEWAAALQRNGPQVFRKHLENLVRLLLAQGRRVVIVPQVYLPRDKYPSDATFALGVREHNRVNQAVAEQFHVPFVAGAEAPDVFERRDLTSNDPCHFSVPGHEKMAELLFRVLESEHDLPAPALPD